MKRTEKCVLFALIPIVWFDFLLMLGGRSTVVTHYPEALWIVCFLTLVLGLLWFVKHVARLVQKKSWSAVALRAVTMVMAVVIMRMLGGEIISDWQDQSKVEAIAYVMNVLKEEKSGNGDTIKSHILKDQFFSKILAMQKSL